LPNSLIARERVRPNAAQHRLKIQAFVTHSTEAAWIIDAPDHSLSVGAIMVRFRDRFNEEPSEAKDYLFRFLEPEIFPPNGRFCEIFQLWVHPDYRRQGLASRLKQQAEQEAVARGMSQMYTHTEERNTHVIDLNLKLGYRAVRRGPIWDDIIRVSLVKDL
jgi:ribosomal protein S18 acetylase RimI-like enzyme